MKIITKNIWILSLVSLFTDVASEMLYPVMPVYLRSIGFSIVVIGVLEGFAEATAGLSKGYFGNMSDNRGKRLPFVRIGYSLSAISKPMVVLFTSTIWVFFARTLDRLGKGVRTGARDALLSDEASTATKGRVFGFHRAMDTFGAVLGPLLALIYLHYNPENYKSLFFIAFVPGAIAIGFTFLIREKKKDVADPKKRTRLADFLKYWKESPPLYRKITVPLLVFTLFNSSDVFLLLRVKEAGFSDVTLIGMYIFYNLVYAVFSFPLGMLADRIGMKRVFIIGLTLFAVTYIGMALTVNKTLIGGLFFIYGIYAAATEGVAKAWITNICRRENTATAVGTYTAFQSVATLIASSIAGLIWFKYGAPATFMLSGIVTILIVIYLAGLKEEVTAV